jgi:hypothetical protein
VVIMVTFFAWTRETRSSASTMGWLESARRASMADRIAEVVPAAPPGAQARERAGGQSTRAADVDENDDQLAAYNAYLARISGPVSHRTDTPKD